MNATRFLALGAMACIAACLVTVALPALVGASLAALGAWTFGWEIGMSVVLLAGAAVAWLYLRWRRSRAADECAKTEKKTEAAT